MIYGKQEIHAAVSRFPDHLKCIVEAVFLKQGLADSHALCLQEGIRHTAADDNGVGLFQEIVDDRNLIGNLCTAEHRNKGALRVVKGLTHDGEFLIHQQAGISRQIRGNSRRGGMSAVNRTECIGNKQIRHVSQGLSKICAVLLLANVKTEVFQKHDLTRLKCRGLRLGIFADDVAGEDHFLPEQFGKALGNRSKRQLCLPLALGFPKVGAGNHRCAVIEQITNGGKSGNNPFVAGDFTGFLVLRHVEVAAEQDLFAFDVHVIDGLLVVIHFATS